MKTKKVEREFFVKDNFMSWLDDNHGKHGPCYVISKRKLSNEDIEIKIDVHVPEKKI